MNSDISVPQMPKQYTPVTSAIEFDCVSVYEMLVKGENTRRFGGRSLALFTSLKVDVRCSGYNVDGKVHE